MVKIKVCGITNFKDASSAVALGADFLGFIFHKDSPRNVSVKAAAEIIKKLPLVFQSVGVFVDEAPDVIVKTVKKCGLNAIQLHGSETPEFCSSLRDALTAAGLSSVKLIKAFKVKEAVAPKQIVSYAGVVNFILLDTYSAEAEGGTGAVFDWDAAVDAKKYGIAMFFAGGLTPENVVEAVEKVQPFAVDVSSGVERLQRRKDFDKLKRFISCLK
jgi:phosphoribosylanthranilate isomerase